MDRIITRLGLRDNEQPAVDVTLLFLERLGLLPDRVGVLLRFPFGIIVLSSRIVKLFADEPLSPRLFMFNQPVAVINLADS